LHQRAKRKQGKEKKKKKNKKEQTGHFVAYGAYSDQLLA
jgi:hypothetical protein